MSATESPQPSGVETNPSGSSSWCSVSMRSARSAPAPAGGSVGASAWARPAARPRAGRPRRPPRSRGPAARRPTAGRRRPSRRWSARPSGRRWPAARPGVPQHPRVVPQRLRGGAERLGRPVQPVGHVADGAAVELGRLAGPDVGVERVQLAGRVARAAGDPGQPGRDPLDRRRGRRGSARPGRRPASPRSCRPAVGAAAEVAARRCSACWYSPEAGCSWRPSTPLARTRRAGPGSRRRGRPPPSG